MTGFQKLQNVLDPLARSPANPSGPLTSTATVVLRGTGRWPMGRAGGRVCVNTVCCGCCFGQMGAVAALLHKAPAPLVLVSIVFLALASRLWSSLALYFACSSLRTVVWSVLLCLHRLFSSASCLERFVFVPPVVFVNLQGLF